MRNRAALRTMLQSFVPSYDKAVDIESYLPGYSEAVRRATRMWSDAVEEGEYWTRKPVTNVFELTEAIRGTSDLTVG